MGHYTHLSMEDRRRFHALWSMKQPIGLIAQKLGKHRSTLYRELSRNKEPGGYLPSLAQQKAQERAEARPPGKLATNGILRDYIVRSLHKGWSPEQIAGRMKHQKLTFYACHETIYQFIYRARDKALFHCLAYKKPRRQKRYARSKQACRYGNLRLITQRPSDIETRKHFGHWEGDTILFRHAREKIVTTLVERKSRMVYLIKNPSKHSCGVMSKIQKALGHLPPSMRQTLTFDQGSEFAACQALEQQLQCKVYYCETHSPWQKGTNENMNGRLRWVLPRETDIANVTQEALDQLAAKMNRCPRKCLGYKTPNELFIQQLKNSCRTWN